MRLIKNLDTGFPRYSQGYVPDKISNREYQHRYFKLKLG